MILNENKQAVIENEEVMRKMIGKGADIYIEKWSKSPEKKMYMGYNFAALFLGATWLAYRKMYKQATIIMIVLGALIVLLNYSLNSMESNMDLFLLYIALSSLKFIPILLGIYLFAFGNRLYYRHINKLININTQSSDSEPSKKTIGGTSMIAAISVFTLSIVYFISFILIILSPFVSNY